MGWILSGILLACVIILFIKLLKKQKLDLSALVKYQEELKNLQEQIKTIKKSIEDDQRQFEYVQNQHRKQLANQNYELDQLYETTKLRRMEQLENEIITQKKKSEELLKIELQKTKEQCEHDQQIIEQAYLEATENYVSRAKKLEEDTNFQEQRFNSLIAPLKQYEMDKQARLFYTIQVPEEYHSDIDYLLTTVSQKIQHPDVINKLVWTEYFKSSMDDTIKRVGIKDEPGIYKITNINNGKSYIGKSTNVKKRLQDHVKSSIGIQSIADQAVHHEMLKTGLWNWTFEVITYCDKDQLSELEKYYINFFKTQEFGYNRKEGG